MPVRRLRDWSLPAKLGGTVTVLLLTISLFMLLWVPAQMSRVGETWAERRAVGMARFLANSVAPALEFDDAVGAQTIVDHLDGTPDALYGVVLGTDGKLWVSWKEEAAPSQSTRASADTVTSVRGDVLDVVTPVKARGGTSGTLLVGFSLAGLKAEVAENRQAVAVIALIMFLVALGVSIVVGTFLVRPIRDLTRITANIVSAGDLTQEIRIESADEVGVLAESFRQLVHKLRAIPASLGGLVDSVVAVVDKVTKTTQAVASGSEVVDSRARESTELIEVMLAGLRGVADSIEVLHTSAEQCTSSNLEVGALNDEVATQVAGMAKAVDGTSAAIAQMSAWTRQVSDNIEGLNSSIEETSTTMNEIDVSIRQVEANAKKAADLSAVAATNASTGVESVQKTLDGIEKIRASSATVSETIRSLGDRISHIGKILGVINDVADQTNLLALNAAIIAAQAGEKGRAFAVVADEIKELASRVGASTSEIASLIKTIQNESDRAVAAVDRGMSSVADGVALGHATAEALGRISGSVHEATAMIKAIANTTVEQARSSSQVTVALHRIADSSQQIHSVSQSQAKSSEQITASAGEMQKATQHVEVSTAEQRKRSHQIARAMQSVSEMVRNLNTVQKDQTQSAEQVVSAFRSVQEVVSGQTGSVHQLEQGLAGLKSSAEGLRNAVRQFRV